MQIPLEYYPDLQFHAFTEVTKGEGEVNRWAPDVMVRNFMKPDTFQVLVVTRDGYSTGGSSMNVTA